MRQPVRAMVRLRGRANNPVLVLARRGYVENQKEDPVVRFLKKVGIVLLTWTVAFFLGFIAAYIYQERVYPGVTDTDGYLDIGFVFAAVWFLLGTVGSYFSLGWYDRRH